MKSSAETRGRHLDQARIGLPIFRTMRFSISRLMKAKLGNKYIVICQQPPDVPGEPDHGRISERVRFETYCSCVNMFDFL